MSRREQVHSQLTQEEKRQVFKDTLHGRAVAEAGAIGGRYGAISKTRVIGSGSGEYPRQPANSPWASEPIGQEPPLNQDVNAVEPVGTAQEIEQSLLALSETGGGEGMNSNEPSNACSSGDARSSGQLHPGSSEAATSPQRKRKRKR